MSTIRMMQSPLLSMGRGCVAAWHAGQLPAPYLTSDGKLADIIQNKHHAQLGSTSGSDSNDPLKLDLYEGKPYLYLPGSASNSATIPNLSLGGATELEVVLEFAPDDITAAGEPWTQYNSSANRRVFTVAMGVLGGQGTAKRPTLWLSSDGSTGLRATATTDWPYANGVRAALKIDWRAADGRTRFWTATDLDHVTGVATWVKLGSDVTHAMQSALFANSTDPFVVGGKVDQTTNLAGKYFYVSVATAIGGATNPLRAVSFVPAGSYNATRTSLAGLTGQTVTINRASSGRKSVVVDRPLYLLGTDDYFEVPDHADLNIGVSDEFTVAAAIRCYGSAAAYQAIVAKRDATVNTGQGWEIGGQNYIRAQFSDGTVNKDTGATSTSPRDLGAVVVVGRITRGGTKNGEATVWLNGVRQTPSSNTSLPGSASNSLALKIGAKTFSGSLVNPYEGEFLGVALFRRALGDYELRELNRLFLGVPL